MLLDVMRIRTWRIPLSADNMMLDPQEVAKTLRPTVEDVADSIGLSHDALMRFDDISLSHNSRG